MQLPRFIRLKDAPSYLAMDKNRFNVEVRPFLISIPIGIQGIAFDRLDLDTWAEQYKRCNGCPSNRRIPLWDTEKCKALSDMGRTGTSTKKSSAEEFAKVLAQTI